LNHRNITGEKCKREEEIGKIEMAEHQQGDVSNGGYTLSYWSAEARFHADHQETVSKNSSWCENVVAPAKLGDEGSM